MAPLYTIEQFWVPDTNMSTERFLESLTISQLAATCLYAEVMYDAEGLENPNIARAVKGVFEKSDQLLAATTTDTGDVVGVAALAFSSPTYPGQEMSWLYGLTINPNLQRSGIGRRMMAAVDHVSLEQGCTTLGLESLKDAIPFYKRLGFTVMPETTDPDTPIMTIATGVLSES